MKIHIVQPAIFTKPDKLHRTKTRWVIGITLPYLAALVPQGHEVQVFDDRIQEVDFEDKPDLAAITMFSESAKRGYQLAEEYRKRGIPVVMGGWHATFHAEETANHCDCVAMGEGEQIWPQIIRDFEAGNPKPQYKAEGFHDLKNLPYPKYDSLDLNKYRIKYFPVQSSRGCPFVCKFCEVHVMYGTKYRLRPLEEVVEEVKKCPSKQLQFIDDNFASKPEYTKELLRRLIPLKIKWTALWTMKNCKDEELLDLAKRSGCYHLNMGIESINAESLKDMNKRQNQVQQYAETLNKLNKHGFFYSLNFIFGWDHDTPEIFEDTVDFLNKNKVPMAFFSVLTPRKGTDIYNEYVKTGRMKPTDRSEHSAVQCLFKPKLMEPHEVENGIWHAYKKFYSVKSILKRHLLWKKRVGHSEVIFSNLFFRYCTRRRKEPLEYY